VLEKACDVIYSLWMETLPDSQDVDIKLSPQGRCACMYAAVTCEIYVQIDYHYAVMRSPSKAGSGTNPTPCTLYFRTSVLPSNCRISSLQKRTLHGACCSPVACNLYVRTTDSNADLSFHTVKPSCDRQLLAIGKVTVRYGNFDVAFGTG